MGLEHLTRSINKKYGTEVIAKGANIIHMPRIPTGSLSLDVETGGGIPVGRITTFSGHYSDGKTSIVLKIVAEFQKRFPEKDVVWIDAEGAWDSNWSATLGVDSPNVFVVHPEYSQQAFDIAEQCISHDVGLLVIDSIAALVPKEEAEATMEDWQVGLAARINNKFIRRTHSSLSEKRNNDVPPTVILINQLRESIGYTSGDTEPGGKGIGFAASIRIKIRKGDYYPKPPSNYDPKVVPKGQAIKFFVEKNKTAPPRTRGHVWFYFDTLDAYRTKGSYDRLEELIRYATKYDLITKRGKAYFDLHLQDEIQAFHGSTALAEFIRQNEEVWSWVEIEIMRRAKEGYVKKTEELLREGNDETEGDESSEVLEDGEAAELWSDTVVEGGSEGESLSLSTQVDTSTKPLNKIERTTAASS